MKPKNPDAEEPPFQITPRILSLVAKIMERVGKLSTAAVPVNPLLRRANKIRTIHASLAIENNTLSLEQVTAVINGKRVLGKASEVQEVRNAFELYEDIGRFNPVDFRDLLEAHRILMNGLIPKPGSLRTSSVGIAAGERIVHIAPPAGRIPQLLDNLLDWLKNTEHHPLVKSCVFHYEFEFIHPFMDGNGRMGRLWQSLILSNWHEIFTCLPVESIVRERQNEYYNVLAQCDAKGSSTGFIEFMLEALDSALSEFAETDQATDQVSDQVKRVVAILRKQGECTAKELMTKLNLSHRPTFRKNYLVPAIESGFVELTLPDKPNSPAQKYRIKAPQGGKTRHGIDFYASSRIITRVLLQDLAHL